MQFFYVIYLHKSWCYVDCSTSILNISAILINFLCVFDSWYDLINFDDNQQSIYYISNNIYVNNGTKANSLNSLHKFLEN